MAFFHFSFICLKERKVKVAQACLTLCDHIEKAMTPHFSTLAWKIPWTEEPGGLQSMGSLRVRHDWTTSLSLFTFMHWRRKWQPTPAFLPGESRGRGSLVGCPLWGRTELDTTEVTQQQQTIHSTEFSRPEYWSGQSFPSPRVLPNPGIEHRSPTLRGDSLPAKPQGEVKYAGVGSLSLC